MNVYTYIHIYIYIYIYTHTHTHIYTHITSQYFSLKKEFWAEFWPGTEVWSKTISREFCCSRCDRNTDDVQARLQASGFRLQGWRGFSQRLQTQFRDGLILHHSTNTCEHDGKNFVFHYWIMSHCHTEPVTPQLIIITLPRNDVYFEEYDAVGRYQ